ncbi:MAG: phosphotransferase [Actinomycetota bacterium]|nr:phosphotransferase [Actinomycetota bacterium]
MQVDSLAAMLPQKRWFGAKERAIAGVSLIDDTVLDDGPPPLAAALVRIAFADGGSDVFNLLLITASDDELQDPFEKDVHRLKALGKHMAHGSTLRGRQGSFRFSGAGLDPMSEPGQGSVRSVSSEQSNSSVIFDEEIIMKVLRRVEPGPNPELELARLLTGEGFGNIPAQVGEMRYEPDEGASEADFYDLGIAQRFLPDAVDGWEETLAHIGRLLESSSVAGYEHLRTGVEDKASENLECIEQLGDVTAALHVMLARDGLDTDFSGEPIDSSDLKQWIERAHESLKRGRGGGDLEGLADRAGAIIDLLASVTTPGAKTRVHGDYHLGQTMLTERGWIILDFEGEPARSLQDRRSKDSPLRDVAGMMRSFSYAATAALFKRAEPGSRDWSNLEPIAEAWEDLARERFLRAYLRTAHEGEFLPDEESTETMLNVFEIDKALYELAYERSHRPAWTRIPLEGIRRAVARESAR